MIVFDDDKRDNFFPLSLTRSTGDLRVGILKLRQRISAYFSSENTEIIVASELEELYKENNLDFKPLKHYIEQLGYYEKEVMNVHIEDGKLVVTIKNVGQKIIEC